MLRGILVACLVTVAGCSALPAGAPSDATASTTPSPTGTPISTPATTPTSPGIHPDTAADLDIQAFQAPPVRLLVTHVGSDRTVVNETYEGTFIAEFDAASGPFEPNRSYRIRIRVDGELAWDRTVRHYEGYDLRIGEEGNVTVEGHSMA